MRIAACAIIYRDGKVLLGRRSADREYYPGVWDFFGGHVLMDEMPEAALVRELSEELGIEATELQLKFVLPEPNAQAYGPGEFHVFLVTGWIGEPVLRNFEHDELGWFLPKEVARLDLADPAIADVVQRALVRGE